MLKELLSAWRKRDPISQMLRQFDQMLEHGQWMFREACAVLEGAKPASEVDDPLHERDHQINRLQREIRREVLTHLTVEPESNLPACLVLMSILKDAERIGDYCKNIFELAEMYTKHLNEGRYARPLRDIRDEILLFFEMTREAFNTSDEAKAREVVHRKMAVSKQADLLISQLVRDELGTADAVAFALLARHFKRVSSHLANVASSVFAPLDAIDYSDEPGRVDLEPPRE
jgi:phosphate transport system protein